MSLVRPAPKTQPTKVPRGPAEVEPVLGKCGRGHEFDNISTLPQKSRFQIGLAVWLRGWRCWPKAWQAEVSPNLCVRKEAVSLLCPLASTWSLPAPVTWVLEITGPVWTPLQYAWLGALFRAQMEPQSTSCSALWVSTPENTFITYHTVHKIIHHAFKNTWGGFRDGSVVKGPESGIPRTHLNTR